MDPISYFQAIVLGLLQGFSELFPISSLGHSVVLPRALGWNIHQNDDYFLTFLVSGAAVSAIALLHSRGGFGLVLGTTAVIALGFVVATAAIAVLVNGVEKERTRAVVPAE